MPDDPIEKYEQVNKKALNRRLSRWENGSKTCQR